VSRRRSALLAALWLTSCAASLPAAAEPAAEADALARARAWRGRSCPAPGDGAAPGALAGFAVATLGGFALARRRSR
jgi:MYXO-CTERM domain-containing protein